MILCHGELLIDFIPTESRDGARAYRPVVGGSPGNVAVTLARLEVPVGFCGGRSTDFFGDMIGAHLAVNGVAPGYLSTMKKPTMLAFVDLAGDEPRYAFYDAECATRNWKLDEMPALTPEVKALHFGSVSLIGLPAADDFRRLMQRETARRVISFDPNVRPSMVEDEADYRARLDAFFAGAHVIKISGADLDWIEPGADPAAFAARCLEKEARLVLFTRGAEGATIYARGRTVSRPARHVVVADTVGAGDSAMGGLLAALSDREALDVARLEQLGDDDLAAILDFSLAVAAITCSRIGADPPRRNELG